MGSENSTERGSTTHFDSLHVDRVMVPTSHGRNIDGYLPHTENDTRSRVVVDIRRD